MPQVEIPFDITFCRSLFEATFDVTLVSGSFIECLEKTARIGLKQLNREFSISAL